MFRLVADIHLPYIGSLYWEKLHRHAPCRILRMSVNGASTIVSFTSWAIYIPIGWRHPFIRYWQPLLGKTTATCSQPHHENERQRSINDFQLHILGNLCSNWLQTSIYEILAAFTGKTTVTWSLPHPENERQRSVNSFSCCKFGNQGLARIFAFITQFLTALIGKNTIYQR